MNSFAEIGELRAGGGQKEVSPAFGKNVLPGSRSELTHIKYTICCVIDNVGMVRGKGPHRHEDADHHFGRGANAHQTQNYSHLSLQNDVPTQTHFQSVPLFD